MVEIFESLSIKYVVGGSIASSIHGEPRATADVDILVAMFGRHVEPIVKRLENDFYVDESAIREALRGHSSFNVVHLASMDKIDIFLAGNSLLDREQMQRRQSVQITADVARTFYVTAPENIVMRKLDWYRISSGVSEGQWRDVVGVLKMQGASLDRTYMDEIAAEIGAADLLERALREAGL
ncbi:MAG: hypothetical protein MJE77_12450 [Proteobacteria bacterium]|nr:hypothetical protein [Pseudomonadota bacterium]